MEVALGLYVGDNRGRYPYDPQILPNNEWFYWEDALAPYYPLNWTNPAYHCPGYKGRIANTVADGAFGPMLRYVEGYAYNAYGTAVDPADNETLGLSAVITNSFAPSPEHPWPPAVTDSLVRAPSEMIALADSEMVLTPGFSNLGGGQDVLQAPPATSTGLGTYMDPRAYPPRHGGNYNFGCCDGHAEGMRPSLLFSPWANAVRLNNDHLPHPETWPR
jgi:prepilin-type processing-associated H-X9-DG protein